MASVDFGDARVAFRGSVMRFAALAPSAPRTSLVAFAIYALVSGCSGDSGNQPDAAVSVDAAADAAADAWLGPDPTKLIPTCFSGGTTPQLDLTGPIANWTWNDPHVVRSGADYWMYASATNYFQFPVRLYRLTSTDAQTWSAGSSTPAPILDVGASSTWDAGGVETPAVVQFKGAYHLFYTGYRYPIGDPMHAATDFRIGHATSNDGVTFTRIGTTPVVAPSASDADQTNDWYAFVVGEPAPVVVNGTLYVYFTALGADTEVNASLQVIGVVSTTDGVTWTAPQLALKPDQTQYPRADDWVGYSTPNALALADGVHLFVDVARQPSGGAWKQLRIHHARSVNGTTGWQQDATAIRSAGDFAWAVEEIRSPHALLDGTLLRLYVAGHELDGTQPDHFAIGMLTCDLGVP